MLTDGDSTQVSIGGKHYRLRGGNPRHLQLLAAQVDRALGEVAGPSGPREDFKIGVLACMNLAAEHEARRTAWLGRARDLRNRTRCLDERLVRLAATLEPLTDQS